MKLKTLKDIETDVFICTLCRDEGMPKLRQEAIKWIKEIDVNKSAEYVDGMMDFIMSFFNITEEELK